MSGYIDPYDEELLGFEDAPTNEEVAQVIQATVDQRVSEHAQHLAQTTAELAASEAERQLEKQFGEKAWNQIREDVWRKWGETPVSDDVLESPHKLAESVNAVAWSYLLEQSKSAEEARREADKAEWERIVQAGPKGMPGWQR